MYYFYKNTVAYEYFILPCKSLNSFERQNCISK